MVSKMKGPAMPAGDVGHDGATGELFVKGGWGGERWGIQLKSIFRYRCKWDPKNETHRKR
jgi:hypothetical protein